MGKNSLIINPEYGPWIRLQSILTDAPLVPDEAYTQDQCKDCTRCIDACPTGALTPYMVDPEKCLIGITEKELAKLIEEDLSFTDFRDTPDKIFREHMPRFTKNSVLMCTTCQKACPIGRGKRGL
jgi:epoxyqueuosine reductase QueG